MLTVSLIIPNYNGENLLRSNLPSIGRLVEKNKQIMEVLIVDDASTDKSVAFIKKNYPHFQIIRKTVNSGFSDTVNLGVDRAKGDLVLILNTDVSPNDNVLDYLFGYFDNDDVFAVGCLDNSLEKGGVVKRGRGTGEFKKGFLYHQKGDINKTDTLWVSGGSAIFNKKIWRKLNGFDNLYNPFYWEDIDLSYRALKSGYEIYFEKRAQVTHQHLQGSIMSNFKKSKIKQIAMRNQIIFVWKNISSVKYLFNHIIYLIRNLIASLVKLDFVFFRAFLAALVKLPKIIYNRKLTRRYWVLSDEQVLAPFLN